MTPDLQSTQHLPILTPAQRDAYPENPVLVRVYRGRSVESQHRGAWVLTDSSGAVVEGEGAVGRSYFARSTVKAIQALPLLETGAAESIGMTDAELALAVSSHNAERLHTDVVTGLLDRMGLDAEALLCGPQNPADPEARLALAKAGRDPSALHNNCSGKHAGFLALCQHLGVPFERYLDPESSAQRLVRSAMAEMTDTPEVDLEQAIDGCSAPTFRFPLQGLATAFARVANPDGLPDERRRACLRMLGAVSRYPVHIAGHHKRLCTDIARVTGGRLFPKIGAEAMYAVGIHGEDRALAVKIDDGSLRGLHAIVVSLLQRFGYLSSDEAETLARWRQEVVKNYAGLEVGRTEVVV